MDRGLIVTVGCAAGKWASPGMEKHRRAFAFLRNWLWSRGKNEGSGVDPFDPLPLAAVPQPMLPSAGPRKAAHRGRRPGGGGGGGADGGASGGAGDCGG